MVVILRRFTSWRSSSTSTKVTFVRHDLGHAASIAFSWAELLPQNTASPSRCAPASIASNSAAGPIHQSGTALAAAPRHTDARSKTASAVVRAELGFIFAYGRVSIFP